MCKDSSAGNVRGQEFREPLLNTEMLGQKSTIEKKERGITRCETGRRNSKANRVI